MQKYYRLLHLEKHELIIWGSSIIILLIAFLVSGQDYFNLVTSLFGVTALIYLAKGEPLGQILSLVFSVAYALVSLSFGYYGELITYVGMTLPSALFATIIWLKHPYKAGAMTVKVGRVTKYNLLLIAGLAPLVTLIFFFILRYLKTPYLIISTISITTSFIASMFTFFRSRFYALAYALNDIVLIIMWSLATAEDLSYLPMIICFIVFLVNDLYAFFNWKRLELAQRT